MNVDFLNEDLLFELKSLNRKKLLKRYDYLGEGAARMVFALNDNLVIKVPKNRFGVFQNSIENYIYSHAGERFLKYLCPIVRYLPELVVAERAIPLDFDREYLTSLRIFCGNIGFYQDILEFSKTFYLSKDDIRATSSWGILQGKKVLIDYGCPSGQGYKFYKFLND